MGTLNVGVIGLGMGKAHIRGFSAHPEARVVAVADPDSERRDAVCDEFGTMNTYESAEQMLDGEQLDIVSVAVPNVLHKPLTMMALEHGCHVLCEKPMAMNADEADEMLACAERVGKRLMINFSFRFTAQSQALKMMVDDGALGDVYFARTVWHRRKGFPRFGGWFGIKAQSGGGPLIDLGVHRLDLALWLMGNPRPVWVMAGAFHHLGKKAAAEAGVTFDVEDLATAMIRFDNGAMLELEASWAAHIAERELMETRILGTDGGLIQHNLDEGYQFEGRLFHEKSGSEFDTRLHPPKTPAKSAMETLADCILTDVPHPATGEEGANVMRILDAIYLSAEKKEPVRIES